MSGRGRGRGRGFAPKKPGFGTEDVPPPLNQPPPIYPVSSCHFFKKSHVIN